MTEREKMLAGLPYDPGDPDLRDGRARAVALTVAINAEPDRDRRGALVNELVTAADGKAIIMPGSSATTASTSIWARGPLRTPTACSWTAPRSVSATTSRPGQACSF